MNRLISLLLITLGIAIAGLVFVTGQHERVAAQAEPTIDAFSTQVAQSEGGLVRTLSPEEDRGLIADLTQMTWEEEQAFIINDVTTRYGADPAEIDVIDIWYVELSDLPAYGIPETFTAQSLNPDFTYVAGFFKGPFDYQLSETTSAEYVFVIYNREMGMETIISLLPRGSEDLQPLLDLYPEAR